MSVNDGSNWVRCEQCGGVGFEGHDCGEDCCACLDPRPNIRCDICGGKGGWYYEDEAEGAD